MTCSADGKSARALKLTCTYVCGKIAYFNRYNLIGIMNVNTKMGKSGKYSTADLARNFGRGEGETLVGTLCFNLEGFYGFKGVGGVIVIKTKSGAKR